VAKEAAMMATTKEEGNEESSLPIAYVSHESTGNAMSIPLNYI
jgi:hypothetical protein